MFMVSWPNSALYISMTYCLYFFKKPFPSILALSLHSRRVVYFFPDISLTQVTHRIDLLQCSERCCLVIPYFISLPGLRYFLRGTADSLLTLICIMQLMLKLGTDTLALKINSHYLCLFVSLPPGFTEIMSWHSIPLEESLPHCEKGDLFPIGEIKLLEKQTSPPDYLTEAELITLMEKHGIGRNWLNLCYPLIHPQECRV